ncbi:hypothetical protein Q1695_006420 [Nippostrongylus brasiliensis]|nr:hypothetical protein Q1695_006420 [Nippostrongylus brasiliensis]
MWSASEALKGLVPNCICGATYDLRFYAPHTLPCAHTFCLMCLSKESQTKKRRCPSCRKKYSTFVLNVALAEVVVRVRQRREWLEHRSMRCDECEARRPAAAMRRCVRCTRDMNKFVSPGLSLDCVICLECCVDRHNGHQLACVATTCSSSRPAAASTPRITSHQYVSKCDQKAKIQHWLRTSYKQNFAHPRVPGTSSVIEEETVYEARCPLYYEVSSASKNATMKNSIVKRLSGLLRSMAGSRCSISSETELPNSRKDSSQSSGMSSGVSSAEQDSAMYQRVSPYSVQCLRGVHRSSVAEESIGNPCRSYYVNIYGGCAS